jgi:hypothetical protein
MWFDFMRGQRIFLFPNPADRLWDPSCKVCVGVVILGVHRPRTIADNSSSVAEDKNEWCSNFTPLCAFMTVAGFLCLLLWLDVARRLNLEALAVWYLRLQEIFYTLYGGSKFLWNIGIVLQDCTVSQSKRLQSEKFNVEIVGMSPK